MKAKMQAEDFLEAGKAVLSERGKTYDPAAGKERSMKKIVTAFGAITGIHMSETEGWEFMACVKQVRAFQRPEYHADSWQDFVNYAALGAEAACAVEKPEPAKPFGLQGDAWKLYADEQDRKGFNVQAWTNLDYVDQDYWVEQASRQAKSPTTKAE